jgi:hypothetical protein
MAESEEEKSGISEYDEEQVMEKREMPNRTTRGKRYYVHSYTKR